MVLVLAPTTPYVARSFSEILVQCVVNKYQLDCLSGVLFYCLLQIVDKALEEPKYSSLYAQLCLRLAEDAPNFDGPSEIQTTQKQSTVCLQTYGNSGSWILPFVPKWHCTYILQTFRRLLITKLQDEFENRTKNVESE